MTHMGKICGDITDDQWFAMLNRCPPDARVVGMIDGDVIVRRPDGTGVRVTPEGRVTEITAEGRPLST